MRLCAAKTTERNEVLFGDQRSIVLDGIATPTAWGRDEEMSPTVPYINTPVHTHFADGATFETAIAKLLLPLFIH